MNKSLFPGETNIHLVWIVNYIVMGAAVISTLWSGIDYVIKGKNIIFESK